MHASVLEEFCVCGKIWLQGYMYVSGSCREASLQACIVLPPSTGGLLSWQKKCKKDKAKVKEESKSLAEQIEDWIPWSLIKYLMIFEGL